MSKNIIKIIFCVTYLLSCSESAPKAEMRSAKSERETSTSADSTIQDESTTTASTNTANGSSTTVPTTVAPTGLPTVTSLGINLKWNLDKDCSSVGTDCNACTQFTTSTCPANPGGLACSTAYAYCVTPGGCRRFRCF